MTLTLRAVALCCLWVSCCLSYKIYQDSIPNGGGVPHPCKPNYIWQGVGHQNVLGGGARNPFGVDFIRENKTWTVDLCNADSDGDGKTNGKELGDPNCIWTPGNAPVNTLGLSHPGVCEPTDSADCLAKNSWTIDCSEGEDFTCEGLDHPDNVNVTLRFNKTAVPVNETTYMCQSFTIPSDREYHLFATKPEIDNAYVLHHMLLYGCQDDPEFDTPTRCDMGSQNCFTLLGGWTVGLAGECENEDNGFLVGKGHFTRVLLEQHWNNPTNEVDYEASSGLTVYLTPNLRKNNLGSLVTGQVALAIPPGQTAYTVDGTCPEDCVNRLFNDTVYITSAHLHMHYLGASGKIEHLRDGKLHQTWFSEDEYSYDLPVTSTFDPPIEFRRGDEIKTTCVYKSTSKSEVTTYGDATSDEMCYGFMNYYPVENGQGYCVSVGKDDACTAYDKYLASLTTTPATTTSSAAFHTLSALVLVAVLLLH